MVLDEVWSVLLVCLAFNASREDERTNEGMPALCSQQGRTSLTHSFMPWNALRSTRKALTRLRG